MRLTDEKEALRREMKALRLRVQDREERDARIAAALFSLPAVQSGTCFFLYRAANGEAGTARIAARLLREGKTVLYPRVRGREMDLVPDRGLGFSRGAFGIEEPTGEPSDREPDVVILPMLAADGQLHRLGYGGGYYDRYLAAHPAPYKAAIAYDFQIVERVPHCPHDVLPDAVVTDLRILRRQ